MKNLFHGNFEEYAIGKATYPEPPYSSKNYGIGIQTSEVNLAFHMHAAVKLNDTAINENAKTYDEKYANIHNAWTWADSATYGRTTSSSYAWISGRDPQSDEDKKLKRHKDDSTAPKIYYNGKEITDDKQTINLHTNDKLSFTTSDNKGHIEKFSISGLTKDPTITHGAGSEDKPLLSDSITVTKEMNGKRVTITSEDGSGNVTTRKVKVKVTTLAKEHPLSGKTIDITVGDKLPELTELVEIKDGDKLKDNKPTLVWNGTPPKTDTVGVFTHGIKGTYSDNSTSITKPETGVIIRVKPKKPVIDTVLTNLAGKKGQKVTVSVGDGIPTDANVTTTVKLFDKNNNEIGSTTTINNGKAEITVKDGIPEGDVYATTTVTKPEEKTLKTTIPGFDLTSENSDKKQATAPKDNEKPTIIATSSPVTVGQDLKIHIIAKDDVKVKEVDTLQALMKANLLQQADILSGRASVSKTTDTDQEQVLDLTVTKMQPKEVGTHTLTLTVTDSAGKTGNVTLTITVKPAAPTVSAPADGKDQGSATITPAKDTDTLVITYTPEGDTKEKTITVKKDNDGNWTGTTPDGVTVDKTTGKVTIPANKVKDGSDVKAKDSKNGIESKENTGKTGTNPTAPAAPTVTTPANGDGQGSATITPAKDTDTLEITYTPEGKDKEKTITVKKGGDGNWTGENTPDGVTVDKATGKVTIPADKVKDDSDVTAIDKKGDTSSDKATGKAKDNPAAPATTPDAPKVEPQDNGSVEVTPAKDTDTLEITYTPEGKDKEKTITVKKGADNKWKKGDDTPAGIIVDEGTGKVTIPAKEVKDNSDVTAIDKKGDTSSDKATGKAKDNPAAPATTPDAPKVEPQDNGSVEVTPAKDTDTLEITYTPEGKDKEKTITVKKGADNKWKKGDDTPAGIIVDEGTGKVTIPAKEVKDNSDVTAIDKKGDTSSDKATGKAKDNPAAPATTPDAPKVEPQDNGSVEVTPAKDTDTLEITYTPEDGTNEKTITVKKGGDGNWTGENTPDGVTVDKATGKVTIPADKVKDDSDVKAKDKKGDKASSEATGKAKKNPTTPATTPDAPKVEPQDNGSVEVTPAKDTDTLEITYTPEDGTNEKTITVKKGGDGNWTGENTPDGVTVDKATGKVTIPADKVKDDSDVKAKDKKGDKASSEATGKAKKNPTTPATTPDAPKVEPQDNGSVEVTPAKDTDTLEITYTPEDGTNEKTITVKKGGDGNWTGENTPDGVTVDKATGKVTIPADKVKDDSDVKAKDKKGDKASSEATGKAKKNPTTPAAKPTAPTVTPQNDGSVDVKPADGTDSLEITYTPEGDTKEKTFTVKKGGDGNWTGTTPEGVTVDKATGKVTIPANKVKDGSDVKAKDKKGNNTSDEATGKAGNNDGNSGSGTGSDSGSGSDTGNSESGNSNGSGSDSGNDSTSNNGGPTSGSTTGGSSSTDSGAQNSTNESSSVDNANNAGNAETGNVGNSNAGNASTDASGSNASTKSGNKVPAKHSSQLVKTGAKGERVGLIGAMIGALGAAVAFFSRKKNRE
ncbi:hypothetical protein [Aerococcus christensenii]|uniref:hypothetical protein n=1 Tax=Aerococcus christensenii TaxID=87541 RepID=UPI0023A9C216|nr:hypothetical protein [Aerococcus christensenii]WEB71114.1 hypothetical protein PUW42_00625 [Aerococcus christensenii]